MLFAAIILISLALVSYTVGVWAERRSGTLYRWHAAAFGLGLLFDASGTWVMSLIAQSSSTGESASTGTARILNLLMSSTGAVALILMAVHLVWAVAVLVRDKSAEKVIFHRFSLAVWTLWLLPYFTGMAAAMMN